ncbi:MAG TPA: hypothetical protein VF432_13450 [Thermoanaerobaculia bacterium]
MRRISHGPPCPALDEIPSCDWWDTLDLTDQIEWQLSRTLCLLAEIRVQLRTPEARPLHWMQPSIDRAFHDTDRILEKLERGAYS